MTVASNFMHLLFFIDFIKAATRFNKSNIPLLHVLKMIMICQVYALVKN